MNSPRETHLTAYSVVTSYSDPEVVLGRSKTFASHAALDHTLRMIGFKSRYRSSSQRESNVAMGYASLSLMIF